VEKPKIESLKSWKNYSQTAHPATRLAEQEGIKVGYDFPLELNTIFTSLRILVWDIMDYIDSNI